jgi:hypothetical protein
VSDVAPGPLVILSIDKIFINFDKSTRIHHAITAVGIKTSIPQMEFMYILWE